MISFAQTSQTKNGSIFSNIVIAGSTTSWANTNNAISSNNIYTTPASNMPTSGSYSDYLEVSNFNFSIPTGSVISGIVVSVERSDGNGKSKDSRIRIVKGGFIGSTDKSQNAAWGSADAVQSYGSNSDLWGNSWSVANVNANDFGFAFSAQRTGGGAQATLAKVDEVVITVYYSTPLPIDLVEFIGTCRTKAIELTWETASEINNDYFTIERSIDGIDFKQFITIPGIGNSSSPKYYSFRDQEVLNGRVFYRLSQTDFDGISEVFEPIAVTACKDAEGASSGLINYTQSDNNLTVHYHVDQKSISLFQVYNINGQLIYSEKVESEAGFNEWKVSKYNISLAGTFLIKMDLGNMKTEIIKAIWSQN